MRFRERLRAELRRRRSQQPTYSVRRFARVLGVHHATVLRALDGSGPLAERSIRALGPRLGLAADEIERFCELERDESVLAAIERPGFRPDVRLLASIAGIPIDSVAIALHSLLRSGRLRMISTNRWDTSREKAEIA